jgi:MerR family transcriptional regulator, heat shock protein HspR
MKKRGKAAYMISNVASSYHIHPQTLRLYERQGLLKPPRSEGNTRLYTDEDLERLELILNLTRELGVNLAGVEIILNMREKMEEMQKEMREFMERVQQEFSTQSPRFRSRTENALVRTSPSKIIRLNRQS